MQRQQDAWRQLRHDLREADIAVLSSDELTAEERGKLDAAVGINSVERFLGDEAIKRKWKFSLPEKESG